MIKERDGGKKRGGMMVSGDSYQEKQDIKQRKENERGNNDR